MSMTKSQIATLKRKAADYTLEVEHLLKVDRIADVSIVPLLEEIIEKNNWSYTGWEGKRRVVPFAKWVEAISVYLKGGCDGLVSYAQRPPDESWHFALAVLEELHTPVSILAIVELAESIRDKLHKRMNDSWDVVYTINNSILGPHVPTLSEPLQVRLRDFLHAVLLSKVEAKHKDYAISPLGRVGDSTSIGLLQDLRLSEHWESERRKAIRHIKKRCRDLGSDS